MFRDHKPHMVYYVTSWLTSVLVPVVVIIDAIVVVCATGFRGKVGVRVTPRAGVTTPGHAVCAATREIRSTRVRVNVATLEVVHPRLPSATGSACMATNQAVHVFAIRTPMGNVVNTVSTVMNLHTLRLFST